MAIAKVQGQFHNSYAGTPVTASFTNTPTQGNLLIAFGRSSDQAIANASISGWTKATSARCGFANDEGFWYKVAGAAESKDVTLVWTDSTYTTLIIEEWGGFTGVPTLDKIAYSDYGASATSKTSGTTATTTAAAEVCFAAFGTGNTVTSLTHSNSFVAEYDYYAANMFLASLVVAATAAYETTASWTTARVCGGLIATFKGASAGEPSVYYIDSTTGDDADTGLTEALAWKTYAKVRTVIAAGVTAGDQFLFNRGDTFVPGVGGANWLNINIDAKNGTSGAYCVIGAYGTGDKPVIEQRYTVASAWVDDTGNKWHTTLAWAVADVRRVFLDGVESVEAANAGAINGTDHLWFYNTGTHVLYLYSVGDPGGKTVILCPQAGSISVTNSNYWKFENIEWRGGYSTFELGSVACSYLEWNGCEFNYGSFAQIMSYYNLAGNGHHHLTMDGCTFDGKGALISKAVTETELADTWMNNLIQFDKSVNYVTITDCTFRDGYHSQININVSSATGYGINYVTISGCSFYGTNSPYIRPFQFAGPAGKCTNNQFVRNYINDVNVRAQVGGTGNLVAYNIWETVRVSEETTTARENALCLYAVAPDICTNNLIYNNTFYNIDQEGIWLNQHDGTFTENVVANNIFWNCGQRLTDNSP